MQQLYTPQTVKYIASASGFLTPEQIARYLGWEVEQLQRIAQKHRIKLTAFNPSTRLPSRPVIRRPKPKTMGRSGVRIITSDMTLDEIKSKLGPRQAQILGVLESTLSGEAMNFSQIKEHCGLNCKHPNITNALRKIDDYLTPTRWRVEFAGRQGGGYRLVVRT